MRILYILRHNPWGIGGGCYACRNYLETFTEIFTEAAFDVLICEEYLNGGAKEDFPNCRFVSVKPRSFLSKCFSPLTHILHRHHEMAKQMLARGKYEYCIFDDNGIAGTLVGECRRRGLKTIVLNHNCEVEYYRDNSGALNKMLILPSVKWNENKSYKNCDYNIFLTEEDEQLFKEMYGYSKTKSIVGGCFLRRGQAVSAHSHAPFHNDRLRLAISGTIGNVQNLDGINYFLDELYPCLPVDLDVVIAGKNPPQTLTERIARYDNVTLIANPKDMDAVLGDCDIFLCPTRLGGGMKLRMMDGLRNGMPVIAHSVSARGYSYFIHNGMMKSFSSPDEFKSSFSHYSRAVKHGDMTKEAIAGKALSRLRFTANVERIKNSMAL